MAAPIDGREARGGIQFPSVGKFERGRRTPHLHPLLAVAIMGATLYLLQEGYNGVTFGHWDFNPFWAPPVISK